MFRHLEVIRRKKKEEIAPVEELVATPETKAVEDEEASILSRRNFLKGMGATAAIAAMPTILHTSEAVAGKSDSLDPIRYREQRIDTAMAEMQSTLKSPEIARARNGTGPSLSPMLNVLKRFDVSETAETTYDCTDELKRYAMQFGYGNGKDGKRRVGFVHASEGQSKYLPHDSEYGNGFFWGRKDIFVTAQHVLDAAHGKPDSKKVYDIAFLKLPPDYQARPEQIVHDDPQITDADIDGQFVSILGVDNDRSALKEGMPGCKMYQGGAERLTKQWVDKVFVQADQWFKERLYRSFMMEIPSNEATGAPRETTLSAGMSGALVVMVKDKKKYFAGMLHSVYKMPDGKSVGFFYGPEAARHQFAAYSRNVASL